MEIEMKYSIKDKETAKNIWDDEYLLSIEEKDSREKVYMKAAYFDTDDHILSKNDTTFRIRMEGTRIVATLKWNGTSEEGLHKREEINVPVKDEACFISPSPLIFKESDIGQEMIELIGSRKLNSMVETHFLRSKLRVDTGKSICEVAIDVGEIITDVGNLPICELEIELFSGEQEDVKNIGTTLAEKYDLVPEDRTKYFRGWQLLKNKDKKDK